MSKSTPRGPHDAPLGDDRISDVGADAAEEDEELLLLALLDQLQSDYAAGRRPDLAAYCAANPSLKDAFLALAMDPREPEEEPPSETDSSRHGQVLSPGVLRALATIPEFSGDADDRATGSRSQRHERVAEERGSYDLKSRVTSTSKGDS